MVWRECAGDAVDSFMGSKSNQIVGTKNRVDWQLSPQQGAHFQDDDSGAQKEQPPHPLEPTDHAIIIVDVNRRFHQLGFRCETLIASLPYSACKLGSVVDDEVVASNAASSVSHTHAGIGAILAQTAFLEALGHSPPYISPVPPSNRSQKGGNNCMPKRGPCGRRGLLAYLTKSDDFTH